MRIFRAVEGIARAAIILRGQDGRKVTQAFGANPAIPAARAQGNIRRSNADREGVEPPDRRQTPRPRLKVDAFATDLKRPQ